jgi:lysophospholipase L1-like esterase
MLQKICWDTKILNVISVQAATLKRSATSLTCPPDRLLPAFDSGDHLHPNDAGYKAMAASIDLRLFTQKK